MQSFKFEFYLKLNEVSCQLQTATGKYK